MKLKANLFHLLTLFFFGFFSGNSCYAQSIPPSTQLSEFSQDDEKYLQGFDENAVIQELIKAGVAEINFKEIISGRKKQYINLKKGKPKSLPLSPAADVAATPLSSSCNNMDFEDMNFTNWLGATGLCTSTPVTWTPGLVSGPINTGESNQYSQHDILTDAAGYDHHAGLTAGVPNIPYLAPGGAGVSVRLGNSAAEYGTEKLTRSILVTPTTNFFSYKYAVVLQSPTSHTYDEQPFFSVTLYDGSGNAVNDSCTSYKINGLNAPFDTAYHAFNDTDPGGSVISYYKKWDSRMIDLNPYMGQTVTIEFLTQDCKLSWHYGYAYIDASCLQLQTQMPYCEGDDIGILTAPTGYYAYQWYTGAGVLIPGQNTNVLTIPHPVAGSTYFVQVMTHQGCFNMLYTTITITPSTSTHDVVSADPTCNGYSDGSAYVVQTGGGGPFTYSWHNSDGTTLIPSGSPDSLSNLAAGIYAVTIHSSNGCIVTDSIHIAQPAIVLNTAESPVCPNEAQITMNAPASGTGFQWYDANNNLIPGATNISYTAASPVVGQTYSVNYLPPFGCPIHLVNSFYLYQLNPPPFVTDDAGCFGYNNGSAIVYPPSSNPVGAAGPYSYEWIYQGSSAVVSNSDSLHNAFAGTYTVTATSAYGCSIDQTIIIGQEASHYDSLKISTNYCPGDDPIILHGPSGYSSYAWYADQNANGTVISTADSLIVYQPSPGAAYTLEMPGIAPDSCDIILKIILDYSPPPITPDFITKVNVFTPNDDGLNDYFMLNEKSFAYIADFHIKIYNRWGRLVFKSDDITSQWNGKVDGASGTESVYYWIAEYKQACLLDAPVQTAHGFVQVLR